MKKIIVVIVVVLSCIQMNAQTLTSVVYDKATKQPVSGAYAYLNGTSIVGVTTNTGKFTLQAKQIINTKLVLSHIAYNTIVIENPFIHLSDTIYMEEQANILGEVIVHPDQFSRRQKLRAFREQFLGMTPAGRSCRIVNEDDINIWFQSSTKTLFASSDKPIEVINEYLGYRVLFELVDFKVEYYNVTLNPNRTQLSYYAVTSMFADLSPDDTRLKRRRDNTYEVSSKNFFKNLAYNPLFRADTLDAQPFRIYKNGDKLDICSHFIIKDTLSLKSIYMPDAVLEKGNTNDYLLRITVSNRDSENPTVLHNSRISFFTNTLLVDQYGNIDQFDKVVFWGRMGLSRAGDMLPLDYEP